MKKKRILCFGDSNTFGEVPGKGIRHPEEVRWTGILQKELGDGYRVIEEGYGGRTTVFDDEIEGRLSGLKYFRPCCESQAPLDLIILMLGTNDLKYRFGVDARTIAFGFQRYLDVVHTLPESVGKPRILLVAPIQINPAYKENPLFHDMFGDHAVERSQKFAEAYREFADGAGIDFLDASLYGEADPADGVHMAPESHRRLAEAMVNKVRELIG
jgi:lysophospholipase L1-like esterase